MRDEIGCRTALRRFAVGSTTPAICIPGKCAQHLSGACPPLGHARTQPLSTRRSNLAERVFSSSCQLRVAAKAPLPSNRNTVAVWFIV